MAEPVIAIGPEIPQIDIASLETYPDKKFLLAAEGRIDRMRKAVRVCLRYRHFMEESLLQELPTESPLVRLLRAGVLLGAMILIPGVAVCWNLLPKPQYETESVAVLLPENEPISTEPELLVAHNPEASLTEPPILYAAPFPVEQELLQTLNPLADVGVPPLSAVSVGPIRAMNWETDSQTQAISIPSSLPNTSIVSAHSPLTEASGVSQRSFPLLDSELQALGVKYYRLEKWGSRGELFRFSCYVASAAPYGFQKFFQEIDSDEIRAIERVISDIKAWRRQ